MTQDTLFSAVKAQQRQNEEGDAGKLRNNDGNYNEDYEVEKNNRKEKKDQK